MSLLPSLHFIYCQILKNHQIDIELCKTLRLITVGGDPEFVVTDNNGLTKDLHSLGIKGTKESPYKDTTITLLGSGAWNKIKEDPYYPETKKSLNPVYQLDNAAFEVNLPVNYLLPSSDEVTLKHRVHTALNPFGISDIDSLFKETTLFCTNTVANVVHSALPKKELFTVETYPTYMISPDMMSNPKVMRFGCAPDLNAYTPGKENPSPDPYSVGLLRFTGGHISVGLTGVLSPEWYDLFIKCLDYSLLTWTMAFTGQYSLGEYMSPSYISCTDPVIKHALEIEAITEDEIERISLIPERPGKQVIVNFLVLENIRRKFYGKAGSYRKTPFGVEYRAPSSAVFARFGRFHWSIYRSILVSAYTLSVLRNAGFTPHEAEEHISAQVGFNIFLLAQEGLNEFDYVKLIGVSANESLIHNAQISSSLSAIIADPQPVESTMEIDDND